MKKKLTVIGIVAVLAVILAACSSPQATPTQAPATVKATNTAAPTKAAQLEGDPIRGGKLYDSYYSTLEIAAADRPTDNEPYGQIRPPTPAPAPRPGAVRNATGTITLEKMANTLPVRMPRAFPVSARMLEKMPARSWRFYRENRIPNMISQQSWTPRP